MILFHGKSDHFRMDDENGVANSQWEEIWDRIVCDKRDSCLAWIPDTLKEPQAKSFSAQVKFYTQSEKGFTQYWILVSHCPPGNLVAFAPNLVEYECNGYYAIARRYKDFSALCARLSYLRLPELPGRQLLQFASNEETKVERMKAFCALLECISKDDRLKFHPLVRIFLSKVSTMRMISYF